MWKLRLLAVLLLGAGIGLLAVAIHIEMTLRQHRGTGFRRWLGNLFYTSEIESYRNLSFHLLIFAPGLIVSGLGLWALLSWIARSRRARQLEQDLLSLSPKLRRDLQVRNLSGRKLSKELERLRRDKGK